MYSLSFSTKKQCHSFLDISGKGTGFLCKLYSITFSVIFSKPKHTCTKLQKCKKHLECCFNTLIYDTLKCPIRCIALHIHCGHLFTPNNLHLCLPWMQSKCSRHSVPTFAIIKIKTILNNDMQKNFNLT